VLVEHESVCSVYFVLDLWGAFYLKTTSLLLAIKNQKLVKIQISVGNYGCIL